MVKEHLKGWYNKDGNFIYADPKKYNKKLEYLLSNDPEDIMSKPGLIIRKGINPIFRALLPLTSKNKFHVNKEGILPRKRPIIFASTHGFRDDIALAFKTAGTHASLLYGSIPDFYYSVDGYALCVPGCVVVDRKDRESRKSSLPKMEYLMDLGSNMVICPEGVWNKSTNLLILKLYPGIYRLAKKKDALIAPIVSIQVDNDCYAKRMDAIDITKYSEKEGLQVLRDTLATGKWELMEKYCPITNRKDLNEDYWQVFMEDLISTANGLYDYEIENSAEFIDKSIISEEEVFAPIDNINVNSKNAYVYSKTANKCRKIRK